VTDGDGLEDGVGRDLLDRRTAIRRLLGAGFSLTAAAALVDAAIEPVAVAADKQRPVVTKVRPATGPAAGGTHVTIEGHHLKGGVVTFGSTHTTVKSQSATKLVVVSPPGHGTVPVKVKTGHGTSKVDKHTHFAYRVPKPAVHSVKPAEGPPAGGTTVTIHGTHLGQVHRVLFGTAAARPNWSSPRRPARGPWTYRSGQRTATRSSAMPTTSPTMGRPRPRPSPGSRPIRALRPANTK
jgi:hypothetical protein